MSRIAAFTLYAGITLFGAIPLSYADGALTTEEEYREKNIREGNCARWQGWIKNGSAIEVKATIKKDKKTKDEKITLTDTTNLERSWTYTILPGAKLHYSISR